MGETGVAKPAEKPKEKHKIREPIVDAGSRGERKGTRPRGSRLPG
jgi:hypothetical protein